LPATSRESVCVCVCVCVCVSVCVCVDARDAGQAKLWSALLVRVATGVPLSSLAASVPQLVQLLLHLVPEVRRAGPCPRPWTTACAAPQRWARVLSSSADLVPERNAPPQSTAPPTRRRRALTRGAAAAGCDVGDVLSAPMEGEQRAV